MKAGWTERILILGMAGGLQGCDSPIPTNERQAATALKMILSAELDLLEKGRDFWTADISGLHPGIPKELAEADAAPEKPLTDKPRPYYGYLFIAMEWDDTGPKPKPLKRVLDATGKNRHLTRLAWCAYPSEFGKTGNYTYMFCKNMDGEHLLLRTSNQGQPILRWPSRNGQDKAGWVAVD